MGKEVVNLSGNRPHKKVHVRTCCKCHEPFDAHNSVSICQDCRELKHTIIKERERHRRSLPYYLKTDM